MLFREAFRHPSAGLWARRFSYCWQPLREKKPATGEGGRRVTASSLLTEQGSDLGAERALQLFERRRVFDRRQVARIAPFGQRLDRAPQQLA